jgi:hypothetical protein
MEQFLRNRAVLALITLALVLGTLLIFSDDAVTSLFKYKLF